MTDTPKPPIRWGLLGTGLITTKLMRGAATTSTAEIVAVGSRTQQRADAFGAAKGIARAHGSYEALLADPEVDAVYLSLPNGLHHEWTMQAIAAGKHVLCEKPYTRYPAEVEEAFDAAAARGLILQEAFMWRHHPQADAMATMASTIGELQVIRASFGWAMEDGATDVRLDPDLEGGALMDVGCYPISGVRFLAGEEPEEVFGIQTLGSSGVDVRFSGLLRFPSGVVAEILCAFTHDHRGLEAIASRGTVVAVDPWQSDPAILRQDGIETAFDGFDPYGLELDDMAAAIRGERAPRLGRADALGQARTIEALYRSAATGQPVRL